MRSSANLTVGFGIVPIDVSLHVTRDDPRPTSAKTLCPEHMTPAGVRSYCKVHGELLDETISRYEHDGQYVEVDTSLLRVVSDKRIELKHAIELEEIDAYRLDKPYMVNAREGHERTFGLLAATLRDEGKVLVGTAILAGRTRVLAVRWCAELGVVMAHICTYDQDVRFDDAREVADATAAIPEPAAQELEMAKLLVGTLSDEVPWADYRDDYRDGLDAAIAAAAKGEPIPVPDAPAEEPKVVDLMEALRQSVAQANDEKAAAKPKRAPRKKKQAA